MSIVVLDDTSWKRMPLSTRAARCNVDIMSHPGFSLLSSVVCMGATKVEAGTPTAATDGRDVLLGEAFCADLSHRQLRYVILHENLHKALHHCTAYPDIVKKHPDLSNMAMDYVVNLMIEEIDNTFVDRPAPDMLIDAKYTGMSWIEVLRLLLQDPPQGGGGSFDEHMAGADTMTPDEVEKLAKEIDNAVRQGEIRGRQQRGSSDIHSALRASLSPRETPWHEAFADFLQQRVKGDDFSTLAPPNRRFLPLGVVMWSHYTERVGELIVACDTSGSMGGVYPVVFGEIARICETVRPESVRVLWWDTKVRGDQFFEPEQYPQLASVMKPAGGGGTTVSCVADYIDAHDYKPVAVVYLTDGYIEDSYRVPALPTLWGVVDNERFVPLAGQKVNINSMSL